MFPPVHETSTDGTPTWWADLPGPLTGTLVFGVGMRDEPAHLAGITHLIEHLTFRSIEPIGIETNGVVDHESLEFHATGEPAAVVDFLNRIGRSIAGLHDTTDADLALEKAIIEVERGPGSGRPSAGPLTYRYGLTGLGKAHAWAPSEWSITTTEISEWARSWLVASNAALSFTGPVPEGVDLGLPGVAAVSRSSPETFAATPRLIESRKAGVAISLVVPAKVAYPLQIALDHELQARLRHELGLIYSVLVFRTHVDAQEAQIDFVLDPPAHEIRQTVEEVHAILGRISIDGFGTRTFDRVRETITTSYAWTHAIVAQHVDDLARGRLLGREPSSPARRLRDLSAVSPSDLERALAAAMSTLILAYDEDTDLDEQWVAASAMAVDAFDAWQTDAAEPRHRRASAGRVWRGKRGGDTPGTFAVLTSDALKTQRKGITGTIRLSDISLVGKRECGCLAVVDTRGRDAILDPDDWHRGQLLVEMFLSNVPGHIVRPFPSH